MLKPLLCRWRPQAADNDNDTCNAVFAKFLHELHSKLLLLSFIMLQKVKDRLNMLKLKDICTGN